MSATVFYVGAGVDDGHSLPRKTLQELNPTPFDAFTNYDKASHVYTYGKSGVAAATSASTYAGQYGEENNFDALTQSAKMVSDCLLIASKPEARRFPREKIKFSKYAGKTAEQIRDEWDRTNREARERGTALHADIALFYDTGVASPALTDGFKGFLRFHRLVVVSGDWTPFRSELSMIDPDAGIGGTLDMVYRKPSGAFVIVDWKSDAQIEWDAERTMPYCPPPFGRLRRCKSTAYKVQTNIYAHMFAKGLRACVEEIFLVQLRGASFAVVDVPLMSEQMGVVFERLTASNARVPAPLPEPSFSAVQRDLAEIKHALVDLASAWRANHK